MPIPALLAAAPGLIQAGASLFGGGKRRRAEQQAREQYEAQKADLQNFQFKNFAANQENVFEDATINQQADQFQAQQQDATLASGLDALVASGGGGGDAQAFANAALQSAQGRGANIAQQEQANQARALSEQSRLNAAEVAGNQQLQQQQHGQVQQSFNLAQQDLSQAQAARQAAKQQLIGGLSSAAGAFASAGGFGKGGGGGAEGAIAPDSGNTADPFSASYDVDAGATAGYQDFGGGYATDDLGYTNLDDLEDGFPRMKDDPLKRLYKNYGMMGSPFKQNGPGDPPEGPVWNPETKRYEGGGTEALRHEDQTGLFPGVKGYTDLRHLYGDSSYATGGENQRRISGPEFGAALDAYEKKHGKRDLIEFMKGWGEFQGKTGEQYVQAQLNKAQRVKDDEAAWRQSQDDAYNALDYGGRHSVALGMKELFRKNPQLKRQLTQSGVGRGYEQAHKAMSRLLASSNIGSEDFSIEDFHSIRDGLEAAGVNPSEYFTFLQKKKEAPTKRTPLYRMYKNMWKNK